MVWQVFRYLQRENMILAIACSCCQSDGLCLIRCDVILHRNQKGPQFLLTLLAGADRRWPLLLPVHYASFLMFHHVLLDACIRGCSCLRLEGNLAFYFYFTSGTRTEYAGPGKMSINYHSRCDHLCVYMWNNQNEHELSMLVQERCLSIMPVIVITCVCTCDIVIHQEWMHQFWRDWEYMH